MAPPRTARTTADARWLAAICASRLLFSQIFVAYAAILPLLQEAWGMSSAQAGLVQSGWHAGYVVSLFAAGLAADRFGARRTFLVMSFGGAIASLAFAAFADGARSALILYALAGMLSGGSYTPVLAIISQRYPPATRGRAMGWYLAAGSLGYAIGLGLSGSVVAWGGWRMSLYVAASAASWARFTGAADARRARRATTEPARRWYSACAGAGQSPAMKVIWAYTFHSWELRRLGVDAGFLAFAAAHGAGLDTKAVKLGALRGTHASDERRGKPHRRALSDARGAHGGDDRRAGARAWIRLRLASALWVLVAVACSTTHGIGDSSVYSALTEVVSARIQRRVRDPLGDGFGAYRVPGVFGLVDVGRSAALSQNAVGARGVLHWTLPGPLVALRLENARSRRDGGRSASVRRGEPVVEGATTARRVAALPPPCRARRCDRE